MAVLALVITFQPEMRRGLGYLGRMEQFRFDISLGNAEVDKSRRDIEQIISAVEELSRSKTGALIVVEPPKGEGEYVSPGIIVNADISSTLLLTIFFPNCPLHDGAVILRQHKIVAAGVILPMTRNPKLSTKYGTRHRAALGLSEIYDGLSIVVSEETGSISAASRGLLVRYQTAKDLAEPLSNTYKQSAQIKQRNPWNSFIALFTRSKKPQTGKDPSTAALNDIVRAELISGEDNNPAPGSDNSLPSSSEKSQHEDIDKSTSLTPS